ncbi:MAG: DUF4136 domain-containing protein [Desulfobacterales bacterium]|jgi:hypothetical protein
MKHLRLLALCVLTAGLLYHCAPSKPLVYDTTYDFDIRTDFKTMRHYAWLPFPVTATITPLNVDRVKYFVDITLSSRGITESKIMPDFLIEPNVDSVSQIDSTGGPAEYGLYREGILGLNFLLPASRQVVWWGVTHARVNPGLNPQEKDQLIKAAVDDILKKFPPPQM